MAFKSRYLRLRVQISLAKTVMLRCKGNYPRWLIHGPRNVPDVEVLSRVHDEKFAEAVHKTRRTWLCFFVVAVVEHCAPINLDDRQFASIVPDSDRRRVGVMVDAKSIGRAIKSESQKI